MQKILIVDDEENIVSLIDYNLKSAGFQTLVAFNGRDGLSTALEHHPDLIILDLMLPKMDGFDVVRELRKSSSIPVLMLTARSEEFDRVLALELGADDYLIKPFSVRELIARVKAILRRSAGNKEEASSKMLQVGSITIDEEKHQVYVDENEIDLTTKEYDLLKLLMTNPGRVFSREKLLEQLWDYEYFGDTRTIDVHIRHLRKKIEEDAANPRYLKTVWGVGYKFGE